MNKITPLQPTATVIYGLTNSMRREIIRMQNEGLVAPESKWHLRTLNCLADKGIALVYGGAESPIFSLAKTWQEIDVTRKPPKWIQLPPITEKKKQEKATEEEKWRRHRNKQFQEDPPQKIVRPAAVYSNASWEDNIQRILSTPV